MEQDAGRGCVQTETGRSGVLPEDAAQEAIRELLRRGLDAGRKPSAFRRGLVLGVLFGVVAAGGALFGGAFAAGAYADGAFPSLRLAFDAAPVPGPEAGDRFIWRDAEAAGERRLEAAYDL
jgi:hypothetical protein